MAKRKDEDIREMLGDIYQRDVDGQKLWFAESFKHNHRRFINKANYRNNKGLLRVDNETKTSDESEKQAQLRLRRLLSVDSGLSIVSSSSPALEQDGMFDHLNELGNIKEQASLTKPKVDIVQSKTKKSEKKKAINRTVFVSLKVKRLSNVNNVEQTVKKHRSRF